MSTQLSDGRIIPGTNRNEALLASATGGEIWRRGKQWLHDLHDRKTAAKQANHARNVQARAEKRAKKWAA